MLSAIPALPLLKVIYIAIAAILFTGLAFILYLALSKPKLPDHRIVGIIEAMEGPKQRYLLENGTTALLAHNEVERVGWVPREKRIRSGIVTKARLP